MSFSKDIKLEILNNMSEDNCCLKSFLSAIIKTGAEYGFSNGEVEIFIKTQMKELYGKIEDFLKENYHVDVQCKKIDEALFKNTRYEVKISGPNVKSLLIDLNIGEIDKENGFNLKHDLTISTQNECCIKSFVKGAFIACGSASGVDEKNKKSNNYHIEWVFTSLEKAEDFLKLLELINVSGRVVTRKKLFVVYLQKFETISDMLVLFNAQENMLKLNNEFAKRSVMNSVNRQSNCDTANMTKVIDNSLAQLKAIQLINDTIGIEKLGDDLANICMLRLANIEESLQELATLSGMSKSAINYRFGKIMKIAKEIEEEQD